MGGSALKLWIGRAQFRMKTIQPSRRIMTTCCGTQLAGKKNARVKKDTTATFTLLQGGERSRYTAQQNK